MDRPMTLANKPLANSLVTLDRDHLIHPVTAYRAHAERGVTVLESGRGIFLRDAEGRELLDACVHARLRGL
jgi:adenosylmethionine-8-amino-7-oxononanoate aminotransferase